jgi:pimeloyl-ACP methyl ester carboxylesterase
VDKVRSEDGTPIAFERVGQGPPLIFVVGAFNDRAKAAPLAEALKDRFAVFTYDRRGRGDSGDTRPYAVKREIEDLGALLEGQSHDLNPSVLAPVLEEFFAGAR